MSTPVIVYRQLVSGEPAWGQGQDNLISNTDAVAQLIQTRLLLFENEWWANLSDGLPLWQSILGQTANVNAITLLINQRILSTPFVNGIESLTVGYDSANRAFSYTAAVTTQFGVVTVTNIPTVPSQEVPL
jgi:hypothetical protein